MAIMPWRLNWLAASVDFGWLEAMRLGMPSGRGSIRITYSKPPDEQG